MTHDMVKAYQKKALSYFNKAGIVLTDREIESMEVADFGLGMVEKVGLELVVYVNTERVCAKEMVLFPYQCCPEHRHVRTAGMEGKEETFRCRYGKVYLYTDSCENATAADIHVPVPPTNVTVFHETILNPGEQFTIMPGTLHWFAAGDEGAVISEFSTHSTDETDEFTDTNITRITKIQ